MKRVFLIAGLCLAATACATGGQKGGWYTVRKGDTIAHIANKYHRSVQYIAEWNNIQNPNLIVQGKRLSIPPRGGSTKKQPFKGSTTWKKTKKIETYHGQFAWPVSGPIHSLYGIRGGRRHDGVDIGAKRGTPVKAAAGGVVAFSGRLSGYGNLVIVRHPHRYYTAYAHNSKNLVAKGKSVSKGQTIAKVGSTGRSTGPHLHFEIRRGQVARNPLFFLAPRNAQERRIQQQVTQRSAVAKKSTSSGHKGKGRRTRTTRKWQKHVPASQQTVRVNTPFRRKHQ